MNRIAESLYGVPETKISLFVNYTGININYDKEYLLVTVLENQTFRFTGNIRLYRAGVHKVSPTGQL